jgi:hypothetical protein
VTGRAGRRAGFDDATAAESPDVEIFWPSELPPDDALQAQRELKAAGVAASCRMRPPRRGPELVALVLVGGPAMTALLGGVFGKAGEDAYLALLRFVRRLLHRRETGQGPHSVVFTSSSGAQIVFTSELPLEAFRQALAVPAGEGTGVWAWDQTHEQWLGPPTDEAPSEGVTR